MTHSSSVSPPGAVAENSSQHGLKGSIGVFSLVFTVLAYNGPMVVFLGFIPVAILLGNGIGIPVMFLACGVVAALFAAGLVAMGLRLPKPGGFYAYVSAGLGKIPGLGTGFVAMIGYYAANISTYPLGGVAAQTLVHDVLKGPDIPWWVYAIVFFAAASILGYLNINFSAKVLTVFLAFELLLMVIYDISVLVRGGAHGFGLQSFQPHYLFSGSIGIGFIFGIGLYGGFEATIIFRDEVKNPGKTIPRATYAVVAILAIVYSVTAWIFINAYGPEAVMGIVAKNVSGASIASVQHYTGTVAYYAASIMLITSCFALILASHNITARYLYNLSADGVLPRSLSRVHRKHGSPHRASVIMSIACVVGLVPWIVAKVGGATIYATVVGTYSYCLVMLLTISSLAIVVYLLRDKTGKRAVGPAACAAIAFALLVTALVLSTLNFTVLTGTTGWLSYVILGVVYGVVAIGVVMAAIYRKRRPDVYARIGREEVG